jgi:hypothetical protein
VNWLEQWVSFLYRGKLVKLKVKEEVAHISMCEGVRVNKKLKSGNEVMIAHVMLIQTSKENTTLVT